MILTEQEIKRIGEGNTGSWQDDLQFARAIESAVLEKLKAQDKGPWKPGENEFDNRVFVESDDFTHDVRLYINGDFGSQEERLAYADGIADALNHPLPPADVVRISELEAVLRECRAVIEEAQTYCEGPQWSPSMAHDCGTAIAKIDEVLK